MEATQAQPVEREVGPMLGREAAHRGRARSWGTAALSIAAAVAASAYLWSAAMRPSPEALAAIPAWEEIASDVPADRENAAVVYQRAFASVRVPDEHWQTISVRLYAGTMPTGETAAASEALVAEHAEALALVHEAGKLTECVYPLVPHECVTHLPTHLAGQASVVLLEIERALALARRGETAPAFVALADALDCARNGFRGLPAVSTFCDEAQAIELTCLAARIILNECAVADAEARPFVTALRRIRPHADLMHALRFEAAWGVASFDAALGDTSEAALAHLETVADWPDVTSACVAYSRKVFIEEMATVMDNALRPYREVASAEDLDYARLPGQARLVAGRLPSQRVLFVARDESLCWQRMCLIALQIEGAGGAPETLEALQPALDQLSSTDVFSGAPFRYEKTREAFRLYSIGSDLDDDGGRQQQRQTGVARYEGDLVWSSG